MRKLLIITLFTALSIQAMAQEFTTYGNGLIYSENTMFQLRHIVDSLNLSYKTCDLARSYSSAPQAAGFHILLTEGKIKQALADMKGGMPLQDFRKKYPKAEISDSLLVVYSTYRNRDEEEKLQLFYVDKEGSGKSLYWDAAEYAPDHSGYFAAHYPKDEYTREFIEAYYVPGGFQSVALPEAYAYKVGYADCLIDTTTAKFAKDAEYGYVNMPDNWEELPLKKQARLLNRMRHTRVMGQCSMDDSPRLHAVNMAVLSAATVNWEVFLRAHLDIMNDRFERVSDGSYAWSRRQTYIRELEELNIQVLDLMMGISLRIDKPAEHHYTSSVSRTARALSETQYREETEAALLAILTDAELDYFNRLIGYYLISGYAAYQEDEAYKAELEEKITAATQTLPAYVLR